MTATPPTDLILVRHGRTLWNDQKRIQGQADSDLSPLGMAQAQRLVQRLAGEEFWALLSSDLGRTLQTAEIIRRHTGRPIVNEPGLRERNVGIFQGLTWEEISRQHPDLYEQYWSDPAFAPPGGQTAAEHHQQVLECIERIAATYTGRRIVLVTSGGFLMSVFKHAVGLHYQAPRRFALPNAGVNVVRVKSGKWNVLTWGDVSHLTDSSASAQDDTL